MPSDKKREIATLLDDAEQNLRLIEGYTDCVAAPILNEWRYATRHIVDAYFNPDDLATLDRVHSHLKRACYDSFGMLLTYQLRKIDSFRSSYVGYSSIVQNYVSDYAEWQLKIDEAWQVFDLLPGGCEKEEMHVQVKRICRDLQLYIRRMSATQGDWQDEIRKLKFKSRFQNIVGVATILGVLFGLLELVKKYYLS